MLRDILDRTAERISTELHNQSGVEGQLCSVMQRLYWISAVTSRPAKNWIGVALADEQELYGPKSAEVAASRYNLAWRFLRDGHLAEAEKEHLEALSLSRALVRNKQRGCGCFPGWSGQALIETSGG